MARSESLREGKNRFHVGVTCGTAHCEPQVEVGTPISFLRGRLPSRMDVSASHRAYKPGEAEPLEESYPLQRGDVISFTKPKPKEQ
jgi:hypothetical protein